MILRSKIPFFVVTGLLLTSGIAIGFDDECIEYGLTSPYNIRRPAESTLVMEQPRSAAVPRFGRIEGVAASQTLLFRIGHTPRKGEQFIADVRLNGDSGARLTRPGTNLECRQMRWLVTMVDADGDITLLRDRFEIVLGSEAAIEFFAPDDNGRPRIPRWQEADIVQIYLGTETPSDRRAEVKWSKTNELSIHPEAGPPKLMERLTRQPVLDHRWLDQGTTARTNELYRVVDALGNEAATFDGDVLATNVDGVRLEAKSRDPFRLPARYGAAITPSAVTTESTLLNLHHENLEGDLSVEMMASDGPRLAAEAKGTHDRGNHTLVLHSTKENRGTLPVEVWLSDAEGKTADQVSLLARRFPEAEVRRSESRVRLNLGASEEWHIELSEIGDHRGPLSWMIQPTATGVAVNGWISPHPHRVPAGSIAGGDFIGLGMMDFPLRRGLFVLRNHNHDGDELSASFSVTSERDETTVTPMMLRRHPGTDDWAVELLYAVRGVQVPEDLSGLPVVRVPLGEASMQVEYPDPDPR